MMDESIGGSSGGTGAPGSNQTSTAYWNHVEVVFSAVVELGEIAGRAALEAMCAGRADVRDEVESLLAAHLRAAQFMHGATSAEHVDRPDHLEGTCIGPYRLVERIGAGGMGTVYRAERSDGDYQHHVAIKLIAAPVGHPSAARRFRAERQILAGLHHPHIVALLDGGITPAGLAYLAMEYVEGVPISRYCRDHNASLAERIELMRRVCAAVQYSHQHFVIHRDLKPANILVTGDGVPKVLDFGVAQLIEGPQQQTPPDVTRGDAGVMTPNYASPEQIRGLPAMVASDIYALGVLLYELLTGRRPYETGGRSLDEVLRIVLETNVERPSRAAPSEDARPPYDVRRLRGDLDAIVLKALRKAPEDRYASAAALSEDLARHLAGHPVEAREPSLGYVLHKLAAAHKAVFISSAISLVTVVALLGVSLWQTRAARLERARAERRFNDVRQLAHTLIFDIHDNVAPLPGSTPVRKLIVNEGLAYLERLTPESHNERELTLEIARAYIRIGTVQGRPNSANLGDTRGAVASFRRATALIAPLAAEPEPPSGVLGAYIDAMRFLSETLIQVPGGRAEAVSIAQRAIGMAETFATRHPASDESRGYVAVTHFAAAMASRPPDSLRYWQRAGEMYDELLAKRPDDPARQRNAALVEKYLGGYFEEDHDYVTALGHHTRALALDERRAAAAPEDRQVQFDLAVDLSNVAYAHFMRKQYAEAIAVYQRSLVLRERLAATDPKDALSREKVAFVHRQLGAVMRDRGMVPEAIAHFSTAVGMYESVDRVSVNAQRNLAFCLVELGQLQARSDRAVGCRTSVRAFDRYASLTGADVEDTESRASIRLAAIAAGRCGGAVAQRWLRAHPIDPAR